MVGWSTLFAAAGDPSATRTVYAVVVALGVIGVALVAIGWWVVRQTRPERELLAPLELMSERSWRSQEPAEMRRSLDEVRPAGAEPVLRQPGVPSLDDDFEQPIPPLARFDDLQAQLRADRAVAAVPDDEVPAADDDEVPVPDDDEVPAADSAEAQ